MRHSRRRGTSLVQWIVVCGILVLGLAGTWAVFGSRTSNQMDKVAEGVGDPIALKNQWGPPEVPVGS